MPDGGLIFATLAAAALSTTSAQRQGAKQRKAQRKALASQKQAEGEARSAAASERLAQASEARQMRKRKPNTAAIMAKARERRMSGETFLTGSQGSPVLKNTRYFG